LLLRIEATENDSTGSNLAAVGAGPGVVYSGAVAGFPMPVLRYFVGAGTGLPPSALTQLAPADNKSVFPGEEVDFAWMRVEAAALYRLEVTSGSGNSIISALLPLGTETYRAPSWTRERASDGVLRWRVVAMDEAGTPVAESPWRTLVVKTTK
jgi:hypothetical protein